MDDLQKKSVGQDDQTAQQTPVAPVGSKQKELAVASADQKVEEVAKLMHMEEADRVAKSEKDDYWENYSREIELEKEVLEMGGVEKVATGEVPIPEQVAKEMGVKASVGAGTQVSQAGDFKVSGVSLDDTQLSLGVSKPISSGFRWLVEWFIYQLLKAHFHIKKTGGKVVRWKS